MLKHEKRLFRFVRPFISGTSRLLTTTVIIGQGARRTGQLPDKSKKNNQQKIYKLKMIYYNSYVVKERFIPR